MRLTNAAVLETIFAMKGNFAEGASPAKKVLSGIEVAPFKDNADAAVSISADFEMSWAWRGQGQTIAELRANRERRNIPVLLKLLDEYSIPITWATVGHLFLESCTRSSDGLAHSNMPRPLSNNNWTGDWYLHDPCSNVRKDPLWYAPDLIQQVVESRTTHEIGTHSFSHIDFSIPNSFPELIRRELEGCINAMQPFGLRPQSLVFPRNRVEYAYLPLLHDAGIVAVRHRDEKIRLSYPERTPDGIYRVYESMNLRIATHYDYLQKAKIFIRKAIDRHATYSLWFHPSDAPGVFDTQLQPILQYIDSERRAGRVWVATMYDLAAYCEAREQLHLTTERLNKTLTVDVRSSLDTSRYGTPEITLLIPVPSKPQSGWYELVNGERIAATKRVRFISDGSLLRLVVNAPTNVRRLQFTF